MIIGLGHKARQGKDTVAKYLEERYGFVIIRFADALYEECKNMKIVINLAIFEPENEDCAQIYVYGDLVEEFYGEDIPKEVHELFDRTDPKDLSVGVECYAYNGMKQKDSALLQWWGMEFRRKQDEDYWVKIVRDKIVDLAINKVIEESKNYEELTELNIVIPDTRFRNECKMIKDFGGEVWKVERYDRDPDAGYVYIVPYIDSSRDSNRPSEIDLDYYKFDRVLSAKSGDLESLYRQVDKIMK